MHLTYHQLAIENSVHTKTLLVYRRDSNAKQFTAFYRKASVEVRTALHQASVATDAIEDEIDGLDGSGLMVWTHLCWQAAECHGSATT